MELRQLEHFVAVATARSFTVAAARISLSQPALSQSISRLERELGCALLLRNKQNPGAGLVLTAAGESLLHDAVEILDSLTRAGERARRAGAGARQRVVLGFSSSTPHALLTSALRSADPDVETVPLHLTWGTEFAALFTGRVDLAFVQYPEGGRFERFVVAPLARFARVALLPRSHRLAERPELRLEDLAGEPVLDPGIPEGDYSFRDFWLALPRPRAAPMGALVTPPASTVEEMYSFVAAGKGLAISSAVVAEQYERPDIAALPLVDIPGVELGVARLDDEPRPVVLAFHAALADPAERSAGAPVPTPAEPAAPSP